MKNSKSIKVATMSILIDTNERIYIIILYVCLSVPLFPKTANPIGQQFYMGLGNHRVQPKKIGFVACIIVLK